MVISLLVLASFSSPGLDPAGKGMSIGLSPPGFGGMIDARFSQLSAAEGVSVDYQTVLNAPSQYASTSYTYVEGIGQVCVTMPMIPLFPSCPSSMRPSLSLSLSPTHIHGRF